MPRGDRWQRHGRHEGHRGWIYYLASSPRHRKKGIGREMAEVAEKWLKDRSVIC
jgi:GNAT superfamily N-acetyltransferase